ncbi:hypothetical protein EON65_11300 [archaeon]|nr:MAG: hypothetical protein EON65_11300 [archaeon]
MKRYDEEDVFWKQYEEIEQTNAGDYKFDMVATICTFFYDLLEYKPTDPERKLYRNFIAKTRSISTVAGLCIGFLFMTNFGFSPGPTRDHYTFSSYRVTTIGWVMFSVFCSIVMLLTSTSLGLRILKMLGYESTNVLDALGKCIFFFRTLRLVQAGTYTLLDHDDTCIEAPYLSPEDHSFQITTGRVVIDVIVVVCALHLLPFRRVHIIGIFFVEALYQSLRFQSCIERLNIPNKFNLFCWTINNTIIGTYLFNMVFPALTLERSINATQQNVNKLKDAAAEKTYLINTLCADLKVPVQQTSTLLALLCPYATKGLAKDLFSQLVAKEKFDEDLNVYLNKSLSAISGVVDRILFLMRIREGRFVFSCHEDIVLAETIALTVKDLMTCYDLEDSSSAHNSLDALFARIFSVNISVPSLSRSVADKQVRVRSNKSCLSVLLFYSVSMVLINAVFRGMTDEKDSSNDSFLQRLVQLVSLRRSAVINPDNQRDNKKSEMALDFPSLLFKTLQHTHVHVDMRIYDMEEWLQVQKNDLKKEIKSSNIFEHVLICHISFDEFSMSDRRGAIGKDIPTMQSFGQGKAEYADDYIYHYQSCMMLCQEVCKCSGGEFEVRPNGAIEFSLPCVFDLMSKGSYSNALPQQRIVSNSSKRHVFGDREQSAPLSSSNTAGRTDEINHLQATTINPVALSLLCIYSASPSILLLITESLKNAVASISADSSRPTTEGGLSVHSSKTFSIPIFRELNMADMHVRNVVIVSSIEDCRELRQRGYRKRVVLMSERLAYYGQLEGEYDYAVSLPLSSNLELHRLVQWINSNAVSPSQNSIYSDYGGSSSKMDSSSDFTRVDQSSSTSAQFDIVWSYVVLTGHFFFSRFAALGKISIVSQIDSRHMLNYVRWKYLNPTQYFFHHTCMMDQYLLCIAIFLIVNFLSGTVPFGGLSFGIGTLFSSFFIWRRIHHSVFVSWKEWLVRLAHVGFTILTVAAFLQLCRMAYYGRKLQSEYSGGNQQTLTTILESTYSIMSGRVILSFMMSAPSIAKVLSEMIMWPYGFLIGTILFLMSFVVNMLFLSAITSTATSSFVLIMQLIIFASTSVVIVFTERLRRKEYLELREVVMSRDFVERCVNACWRDTRHPLTSITILQSKLFSFIRTQCLQREIFVTPLLQCRLRALCSNVFLSKELLQAMQMSLMSMQRQRAGDMASLIQSMDTHLLIPVIESVCGLFLPQLPVSGANDTSHLDHLSLCYFEEKRKVSFCGSSEQSGAAASTASGDGLGRYGQLEDGVLLSMQAAGKIKDHVELAIHVKVHPSVYLIRFDMKLLQAMLHAACRSAVQRIKASQQLPGGRCEKAKAAEILILVAPASGQETLKFTDIHLLQIKIFDTATPADTEYFGNGGTNQSGRDQNDRMEQEQLFIAGIYERFVRHHYSTEGYAELLARISQDNQHKPEGTSSANYNKLAKLFSLQHVKGDPDYHYLQSIFIPYKLLPMTPKVSQFFLPSQDPASSTSRSSTTSRTKNTASNSLLGLRNQCLAYTVVYEKYCAEFAAKEKPLYQNSDIQFTYSRRGADVNTSFSMMLVLSSRRQSDRMFMSQQLPSDFHCFTYGWERSEEYLSPNSQTYPKFNRISSTDCVVLDEDLQAQNDVNKKYVQDLVLYLRANGYQGLIVLAKSSGSIACAQDTKQESASFDQTPEVKNASSGVSQFTDLLAGLLVKAVETDAKLVVDVDEVVCWPISQETLQGLRKKVQNQLILHSIPALLSEG